MNVAKLGTTIGWGIFAVGLIALVLFTAALCYIFFRRRKYK